MERPSWDQYFMDIAKLASTRSTCLRRQVGAIIVRDNKILSTGYNGAPSGCSHCETTGCMRQQMNIPSGEKHELCRAGHAEANAIAQSAKHGPSIDGATLYSTLQPCVLCSKLIINSGIKTIYFQGDYPDRLSLELLKEAGINIIQL